jgi:hypothetical protein
LATDFTGHLGRFKIGAQAAGIEDGQVDGRAERPGAATGLEQLGQIAGAGSGTCRQADAGEELGPRSTDIGIRRFQVMLGGQNIRAALQQG